MNAGFLYRYSILAVLIITFSISAYHRKKACVVGETIDRKEEGWIVLAIRLVAGSLLLMVLMINLFYPSLLDWAHFSSPIYLRISGLILSFTCIPIFWWTFRTIGKNISETGLIKDKQEMVTSGPYAIVRHPLYATALLLVFSISLVFGDMIIIGFGIFGLLAFRLLIIPAEEKQLLDAFGEEYECYQARTGALVPWIR